MPVRSCRFRSGFLTSVTEAPDLSGSAASHIPPVAGRFADRTAEIGLATSFYGTGIAVGDVDNDGWVDLFISAVGPNRLFRNREGVGFEDVTAMAGVAGSETEWSSSAFFDVDGDGVRNDQETGHRWLRFRLRGDGEHVNRDAIGAWVEVEHRTAVGPVLQRRRVIADPQLPEPGRARRDDRAGRPPRIWTAWRCSGPTAPGRRSKSPASTG